MRTDYSMRPAGALATVAAPTPDRVAAQTAVRAELPAHQTVTAVDSSAPKQRIPEATARVLSPRVVIDSEAATVVYQEVDERTNTVVRQFPEQALLRRRAYLRALDAKSAENAALSGHLKTV